MPALPRNLRPRIAVALVMYIVLSGVVLTVSLNTQLGLLATSQQATLGSALGIQLAESLKQPIIDKNPISMQVILDNLLNDTEAVVRATVYSTSNRILAQSQRSTSSEGSLAAYTTPISVDNTMLGQIRIELDKELILDHFHSPLWTALALWLLISLGFAFWLVQITSSYARRIQALNASFPPGPDISTDSSELDILEKSLEPFTHRVTSQDIPREYSYSMIAISIPNLPKWRAQLNAESFSAMLEKIDHVIDAHLALFNGARLQSRNTAMLVQFDDNGDSHPITRAVSCANALLKLCNQMATAEHLPFEVRITAAYRKPALQGSAWRNNLEREECINRLVDILPLTGSWELIIDKTDLAEEDMPGCSVEEFSAASVWQFRGYSSEQQDIFDKQLAFLKTTLA